MHKYFSESEKQFKTPPPHTGPPTRVLFDMDTKISGVRGGGIPSEIVISYD
jgi:hypothetical protein